MMSFRAMIVRILKKERGKALLYIEVNAGMSLNILSCAFIINEQSLTERC